MLYEEIMMDNPTLAKYYLFQYLSSQEPEVIQVNAVAERFQHTYQQTYNLLTEIDFELGQLDATQAPLLIRNGRIDLRKLHVTLDEYRYALLLESLPFQFVLYLLHNEKGTIEDFCQQNFVSRSTVNRKLKKINQYLADYGMRFSYNPVDLLGDERMIRITLFYFTWLGTRGVAWPFSIPKEQVYPLADHYIRYFSMANSFMGRQELLYFATIFELRISQNHLVAYDHKFDFLLEDTPYFDMTSLNDYKGLSAEEAKGESSFIYFLAHFAPYFTTNKDPLLQDTLANFARKPNVVWDFSKAFFDFVETSVLTPDQLAAERELLLGNLLNITLSFYIFENRFPNMHSLMLRPRPQSNSTRHLQQLVLGFFEDKLAQEAFQVYRKPAEQMCKSYRNLLSPYYFALPFNSKLNVALALEHNHLIVVTLVNLLEDLSFTEIFEYDPEEVEHYDLIISTSQQLRKEHPQIPFIIWNFNDQDTEVLELYQKLRNLYIQKNRVDRTLEF